MHGFRHFQCYTVELYAFVNENRLYFMKHLALANVTVIISYLTFKSVVL